MNHISTDLQNFQAQLLPLAGQLGENAGHRTCEKRKNTSSNPTMTVSFEIDSNLRPLSTCPLCLTHVFAHQPLSATTKTKRDICRIKQKHKIKNKSSVPFSRPTFSEEKLRKQLSVYQL